MKISKIKIDNQSYDLEDKNAIKVEGVKSSTDLNNLLTMDDTGNALTALTQDQIEAIISNEMDKAFPVGTHILLPSIQVTDQQGIGGGSITYTEKAKKWLYAGNKGNKMIFILDDDPYLTEGAADDQTGNPVYPMHLSAVRDTANQNPSASMTQFGYTTMADLYKHLISQFSNVIKDQFDAFFNLSSPYSVSLKDIPHPVAKLPFNSRIYISNTTPQVAATLGYKSNSQNEAFDYVNYKIGLLDTVNVYGSPALPQHIGKVFKTYGANVSLVNNEMAVYAFGGTDDLHRTQFPIFKYNDVDTIIAGLKDKNFLFDDKRMTINYTSQSAAAMIEAFVKLNNGCPTIVESNNSAIANGYFIPYVAVTINEE